MVPEMPDGPTVRAIPRRGVDRPELNLPNLITLARLLCVPLAIWLILEVQPASLPSGLIAAGISDALTAIAKRFDQRTPLGALARRRQIPVGGRLPRSVLPTSCRIGGDPVVLRPVDRWRYLLIRSTARTRSGPVLTRSTRWQTSRRSACSRPAAWFRGGWLTVFGRGRRRPTVLSGPSIWRGARVF
jgi:hypothetical protein